MNETKPRVRFLLLWSFERRKVMIGLDMMLPQEENRIGTN